MIGATHSPQLSTEPRLPLYLVSPAPSTVQAAGGVLLLRSRTLPPRRFPLAHISRIVSSVSNSWEGAALALCLQSNIPIVFMDGRRGPGGWLIPREHAPIQLRQQVDEALSSPSWNGTYSNWLRAERNRVVSSWAGSPAGQPIRPYQMAEWRKRFVYQQADDAADVIPALWRAAVDSLVLRILADSGLPAVFSSCDGQSLQLARDCAALACLHLFPDASGALTSATADGAFLLRCFEARAETLRSRLIAALLRLHRLFSQDLHPWR